MKKNLEWVLLPKSGFTATAFGFRYEVWTGHFMIYWGVKGKGETSVGSIWKSFSIDELKDICQSHHDTILKNLRDEL